MLGCRFSFVGLKSLSVAWNNLKKMPGSFSRPAACCARPEQNDCRCFTGRWKSLRSSRCSPFRATSCKSCQKGFSACFCSSEKSERALRHARPCSSVSCDRAVRTLIASNNRLASVSDAIARLNQMQHLSFADNSLEIFPEVPPPPPLPSRPPLPLPSLCSNP